MTPLLLLATAAFASPTFVGDLESAADMPCAAACTVCHATNGGGSGTVTQAFGIAMMDAGLVPGDGASLEAALVELEADGTDSDDDGTSDVDELAAGTDPNSDASFCESPLILPRYGCFGGDVGSAFLVGALGIGAAVRRRLATAP